jgi:hypothetical protein
MSDIYCLADQMLASQEGLTSMEQVRWLVNPLSSPSSSIVHPLAKNFLDHGVSMVRGQSPYLQVQTFGGRGPDANAPTGSAINLSRATEATRRGARYVNAFQSKIPSSVTSAQLFYWSELTLSLQDFTTRTDLMGRTIECMEIRRQKWAIMRHVGILTVTSEVLQSEDTTCS